MTRNIRISILLFAVTAGVFGCGFGEQPHAEVVFDITEVGTPEGDKATKEIGPGGGTLISPDGRLTLTVPPNALTEKLPFAIQPISNKAEGGLGLAYRLEPTGRTFATPLEISVLINEKDLEGTFPEALSLAYQDAKGSWHELKPLNLTKDSLTVAATHFSDWAFLAKIRIEPAKATLRPGETLRMEIKGCMSPSNIDWYSGFLNPSKSFCHVSNGKSRWALRADWIADHGSIDDPHSVQVVYTAPPKKPTPNVATVTSPYLIEPRSDVPARRGMFISHITIVDRGYRASGQDGVTSYSGVVCDLEKPFEVTGKHPLFTFPFKFTPSSGTAGTAKFEASWTVTRAEGGGPYTIEGADTDAPRIVWQAQTNLNTPVVKTGGGGLATIHLTPLVTGECSQSDN